MNIGNHARRIRRQRHSLEMCALLSLESCGDTFDSFTMLNVFPNNSSIHLF
jgi:hypothetical protein